MEGAHDIERKGRDGYDENQEETEGEGEGEGEEEVDEEEEEAEEDQEDEEEGVQEEEGAKLDEGFFEIEAIRRKRVRKGQLQYHIKWRGWPETANTWEPLENLQSCSEVIDAFEESLKSNKSSRKRKRKSGGPHTQPRKKQLHPFAACSIMDIATGVGHNGDDSIDVSNFKTSKQIDGLNLFEMKEAREYDPKLSELRGSMSTNETNTDNILVHFPEAKASEVDEPKNGCPKVDLESDLNNRCTGAKRRKSGSVKRFKKESAFCEQGFIQNSSSVSVGTAGLTSQLEIANSWSNSSYKPMGENSINPSTITKIIKPIGFSASVLGNEQDVLVTFMAMRADGKEVIVDNKFLKTNNPHLLINFYEQHLKYST